MTGLKLSSIWTLHRSWKLIECGLVKHQSRNTCSRLLLPPLTSWCVSMSLQTFRRALGRRHKPKPFMASVSRPRAEESSAHTKKVTSPDIYTPLNESHRQIRLLRMFPYEDGEISLELAVASLDDKPAFRALSYLWTTADPDCQILVNDQPFLVRPNLYHYLEIMREEDDEELIFIDAVCINQDDIVERSSQVSLMGAVYRAADLVVVWLGAIKLEPDPGAVTAEQLWVLYDGHTERTALATHCLWIFVSAEYWSRVWIIQEVILAKALLFRRGHIRASPDALFFLYRKLDAALEHTLFELLEFSGRSSDSFVPPGLRNDESWPLYLMYSITKQWARGNAAEGGPQARSIADVMTAFPRQACSLTHDRVYGLLGLTDSICQADYQSSTLEVFLRLLIESQYTPVPPGFLKSGARNDHHLCIALLHALDLHIEAPAVHYATVRALELCGADAAVKGIMTYVPLKLRISRYLHALPSIVGPCTALVRASTKCRVSYHARLRHSRLPAVGTLERKTLTELEQFVRDIFDDVQAQILRARRHYPVRWDAHDPAW